MKMKKYGVILLALLVLMLGVVNGGWAEEKKLT